jgi:hypothetical protein
MTLSEQLIFGKIRHTAPAQTPHFNDWALHIKKELDRSMGIKPTGYALINTSGHTIKEGRSDELTFERDRLRGLGIFTVVIDMNNVNYRK